MLSINDLENGIVVKINNDPYAVMSVKHLHIGRGGSSVQTKLRNIKTGQVLERNFKPSDQFEEVEIEKMKSRFLYSHGRVRIAEGQRPEARNSHAQYWFDEIGNPKNRFSLSADEIGDGTQFLKPNLEVIAVKYESKIISVELPIKVDYKVVEAPPAVKGNTAQGGTKVVIIETGAKINTPLFINEGDIIRINTTTGEYTERIEKA